MQIGLDNFVAAAPDPVTGEQRDPSQRLSDLLDEIAHADEVGLDVVGIGEHHREEFLDSAPAILLAAAAARTKRIRLASAVTVLSADDPVRVFQNFATIDILSRGRAEIIAGRGSFVEAYPLFGLNLEDYDDLFTEKLDLLIKLRDNKVITWEGKYRPALHEQTVYPRPVQDPLPVWVGVGGSPGSFARAGVMGLPLMVAIIGGEPRRFRPMIDLYREAGRRAGHPPERLKVGVHALGYVAETNDKAADDYFPGYERMFTQIGRERGWPPVKRIHFDMLRGPEGALMVGDVETVVEKILHYDQVLGGISRITFQMSPASLPHEKEMKAIELLGKQVSPWVNTVLEKKKAKG